MVMWDDRILEALSEAENESMTVGELKNHSLIRVSGPHISRRCKALAEHGLVIAHGNGAYQITDRGKKYLEGEIDTSEDEQDEPITVSKDEGGEGAETEDGG